MRKIALICNSYAGRRFNQRKLNKYHDLLSINGVIDQFNIKDPKELSEHADSLSRDYDLIVLAGGDGTANGVINLLYPTATPFLILPFGSGNDISAVCQHNKGISHISEAISKLETSDLDLIKVESDKISYCATVTCVGTDAMVSARASNMPRFLAGARYILATLVEIAVNKKVHVQISDKDFNFRGLVSICSIANSPRYGAGIKISPKSNPFDATLEFIFVERLNRLQLVGLFLLLLMGLHTLSNRIRIFEIQQVDIKSDAFDYEVWGDGQLLGKLPVRVSRAEFPLKVVVIHD